MSMLQSQYSGVSSIALRRSWLGERATGPMKPGSVLVHAASSAYQAPGGGEIQVEQTARHLEALGWDVRPFVPWTDRIQDARALHLFGMSPEGMSLARVARDRQIPVLLSPICWIEPRAWARDHKGPLGKASAWARWWTLRLLRGRMSWRREFFSLVDAVLPNSESEARQIQSLFGVSRKKIRVVPNGVDPRFTRGNPELALDGLDLKDFVLYVGRIEPRKNVLGLIRAMRPMALPLVIVGDPPPGREDYAAECRKLGEHFVHWVPRLEHDDPRLASLYAAARVFALVSWFETPGLAALEAAAAGTSVVITPFGSTRDYFGPLAHYARPDRIKPIRLAIVRAWAEGPQPGLARWVRNRYLWGHVALRTAEVYHEFAR